MNLYLSAIGFSDMDSMKESRFIKAAVRQCIDEGYILKNESLKRGVAVVRVSESAGIYILEDTKERSSYMNIITHL